MTSLADESALLRELDGLAATGRYQEVLERLGRLPTAVVETRTRFALLTAEAHGRLGDHGAGAHWAETALALARARGERHAELRARNYQGAIALRRGQMSEAEQHITGALELARALADYATQARCLNNLGIIANIRGDPAAALANYRLALVAYQQAGFTRGIAETHHNIGISLRDQGNLRGALEAAEQAVRLATEAGDEQLAALAATGRAALHLQSGDPALAAAELARAAAQYERIGFRAGLAEVWRVEAGVARSRGDLSTALQLLGDAARLAKDQTSSDTLADIERDFAATLDGAGDPAAARAARVRAIALYLQLGAKRAADELAAL